MNENQINYGIYYIFISGANIRFSLCWRPDCNGYFEIVPDIPSPLTDAIADDPKVIFDLLRQKILKPIL